MPAERKGVSYDDMWRAAGDEAGKADDLLREFARLSDQLEPVDAEHTAAALRRLLIWTKVAELIAWCGRHNDVVMASLQKEKAEQAARETAPPAEASA